MFVNSCGEPQLLESRYGIAAPVIALDPTGIATETIGRSSVLSSVVGAVSCKLSGVVPEDRMIRAVREELASLRLDGEMMERNVQAARRVYVAVSPVQIQSRPPGVTGTVVRQPEFAPASLGTAIV